MNHKIPGYNEETASKALRLLAAQCLQDSWGKRPELLWLIQIYDAKRKELRLSKAQMDALLFERIHKAPPEKLSDLLPIRYWRTGHHVPINRETCLDFGQALELSDSEMDFLLKAYFDKSKELYREVPEQEDTLYWKRRNHLEQLTNHYLEHGMDSIPISNHSPESSLRHLYYTDALRFTQPQKISSFQEKHIYSQRYNMEFQRNLKLLGEIPRKTMIRHLLIFGQSQLSIPWMNEQLEFFGYLPLNDDHTLIGGEYLDRLLLGFLEIYQHLQKTKGREKATLWFRKSCCELDQYFKESKKPTFRFMHFKSLV